MKNKNPRAEELEVVQKVPVGAKLWRALGHYRRAIMFILVMILCGSFGLAGWHSYLGWVGGEAMKLLEGATQDNDYEQIIQKYPKTHAATLAMVHLGDVNWKKQEYVKARVIYERFLQIHPDHVLAPFVMNMKGECLIQEGRQVEAKSTFEAILNDSKNSYVHDYAQGNLKRIPQK